MIMVMIMMTVMTVTALYLEGHLYDECRDEVMDSSEIEFILYK